MRPGGVESQIGSEPHLHEKRGLQNDTLNRACGESRLARSLRQSQRGVDSYVGGEGCVYEPANPGALGRSDESKHPVLVDSLQCVATGARHRCGGADDCIHALAGVRHSQRVPEVAGNDVDAGDGGFESELYAFLKRNGYRGWLFLDDIHLNAAMIRFWDSISDPKEDLTPIGHFSGSGLVAIGEPSP